MCTGQMPFPPATIPPGHQGVHGTSRGVVAESDAGYAPSMCSYRLLPDPRLAAAGGADISLASSIANEVWQVCAIVHSTIIFVPEAAVLYPPKPHRPHWELRHGPYGKGDGIIIAVTARD